MLTLNDIDILEGEDHCTEEEYYLSIQKAINGGAWSFQGSYGRAMMDAITAGYCMLGRNRAQDYYGNTIPSRDDVQAGTKGSYEFVVKRNGSEWAQIMMEV